jgi:hypothetical protein
MPQAGSVSSMEPSHPARTRLTRVGKNAPSSRATAQPVRSGRSLGRGFELGAPTVGSAASSRIHSPASGRLVLLGTVRVEYGADVAGDRRGGRQGCAPNR